MPKDDETEDRFDKSGSSWKMPDVDSAWADEIDIAEADEAFFDPRTETVSIYDDTGDLQALVEAGAEAYVFDSTSKFVDFALRVYLAHLFEDVEGGVDLREHYEAHGALPPKGWVQDFQRDQIEPVDEAFEPAVIGPKTVPVVKDMIVRLVESDLSQWETQDEFGEDALEWVAGQDD